MSKDYERPTPVCYWPGPDRAKDDPRGPSPDCGRPGKLRGMVVLCGDHWLEVQIDIKKNQV